MAVTDMDQGFEEVQDSELHITECGFSCAGSRPYSATSRENLSFFKEKWPHESTSNTHHSLSQAYLYELL